MELAKGQLFLEYTIEEINADDESMNEFLFSLGCYQGEKITIVAKLACNYIINIKDARYSIDEILASKIIV